MSCSYGSKCLVRFLGLWLEGLLKFIGFGAYLKGFGGGDKMVYSVNLLNCRV